MPGRGEFFLRDTGGDGPGRDAAARLDGDRRPQLVRRLRRRSSHAGYRVLAIDHRGHGRGLRPLGAVPAGRLRRRRRRGAARARRRRRRSSSATRWAARSPSWSPATTPTSSAGSCSAAPPSTARTPRRAKPWRWMGALRAGAVASPRGRRCRAGFAAPGSGSTPQTAWWLSELMRHSARDIAEAGRELGRFDSRPWLALGARPPAAVGDHHARRSGLAAPSSASWPRPLGATGVRGADRPPRGRSPAAAEYNPRAARRRSRRSRRRRALAASPEPSR